MPNFVYRCLSRRLPCFGEIAGDGHDWDSLRRLTDDRGPIGHGHRNGGAGGEQREGGQEGMHPDFAA